MDLSTLRAFTEQNRMRASCGTQKLSLIILDIFEQIEKQNKRVASTETDIGTGTETEPEDVTDNIVCDSEPERVLEDDEKTEPLDEPIIETIEPAKTEKETLIKPEPEEVEEVVKIVTKEIPIEESVPVKEESDNDDETSIDSESIAPDDLQLIGSYVHDNDKGDCKECDKLKQDAAYVSANGVTLHRGTYFDITCKKCLKKAFNEWKAQKKANKKRDKEAKLNNMKKAEVRCTENKLNDLQKLKTVRNTPANNNEEIKKNIKRAIDNPNGQFNLHLHIR